MKLTKKPADSKLPSGYPPLNQFGTHLFYGSELKNEEIYCFFDKKVKDKLIDNVLYKCWYCQNINIGIKGEPLYFVGYIEEIPKKIYELAKKRMEITKQLEDYVKER